jgi:hypothetical protein
MYKNIMISENDYTRLSYYANKKGLPKTRIITFMIDNLDKKDKISSKDFWKDAEKITKGIKVKSVKFNRRDFDLDSAYI